MDLMLHVRCLSNFVLSKGSSIAAYNTLCHLLLDARGRQTYQLIRRQLSWAHQCTRYTSAALHTQA